MIKGRKMQTHWIECMNLLNEIMDDRMTLSVMEAWMGE